MCSRTSASARVALTKLGMCIAPGLTMINEAELRRK